MDILPCNTMYNELMTKEDEEFIMLIFTQNIFLIIFVLNIAS